MMNITKWEDLHKQDKGREPCSVYMGIEIEHLRKRVAELEAARMAYASEFEYDLDKDGMPNVGNIHQNIRKLKSAYVHAAVDAERYQWIQKEAERDYVEICDGWDAVVFECKEAIDEYIDTELSK